MCLEKNHKKRQLRGCSGRQEDNSQINFNKAGCEDWLNSAVLEYLSLVDAVTNYRVHRNR